MTVATTTTHIQISMRRWVCGFLKFIPGALNPQRLCLVSMVLVTIVLTAVTSSLLTTSFHSRRVLDVFIADEANGKKELAVRTQGVLRNSPSRPSDNLDRNSIAKTNTRGLFYKSLLRSADEPRWDSLDRNDDGQFFVYSAHYDDFTDGAVPQIVVLLSGFNTPKTLHVDCLYFCDDDEDSDVKDLSSVAPCGRTSGLCQNFVRTKRSTSSKYLGAYIKCPLLDEDHRPYALSVLKSMDQPCSDLASNDHPCNNTLTDAHRPPGQSPKDQPSNNPSENTPSEDTPSEDRPPVIPLSDFDDVVDDPSARMSNLLVINYSGRSSHRTKQASYRWNITKCFPAIHGFRDEGAFIEQIEVNRLLGVQHFTVYNMLPDDSNVTAVLRWYEHRGLLDVLNWTLRGVKGKTHTYYGQLDAVQDCLLRHTRSSKYLLFGDFDEFPVPREEETLLPLLERLSAENPGCGSFLFRNTFFDPTPSVSEARLKGKHRQRAEELGVQTLLSVHRVNQIWEAPTRSKPAVLPLRVNVSHVHQIHSFRGNFTQCHVSPSAGLLHHYRKVPHHLNSSRQPSTLGYVVDKYLRRFSEAIMDRVDTATRDIETWRRALSNG